MAPRFLVCLLGATAAAHALALPRSRGEARGLALRRSCCATHRRRVAAAAPAHLEAATQMRGGAAAAGPSALDEFVGETVGTAWLLTLGYGVVCTATYAPGAGVGLAPLAAVWGLGAALGISTSSALSGAHLNPAVSLALAARRGFPARKLPRYVAGQLVGATLATLLQLATWAQRLDPAVPLIMRFGGAPPAAPNALAALAVEAWATAALVLGVLALTDTRNDAVAPRAAPVLIGALLAGLIILTGPTTGAGFNPARDLAPRFVAALVGGVGWRAAFPRGWWIYTVGPVVGALVGALLFEACIERALERRAAPTK